MQESEYKLQVEGFYATKGFLDKHNWEAFNFEFETNVAGNQLNLVIKETTGGNGPYWALEDLKDAGFAIRDFHVCMYEPGVPALKIEAYATGKTINQFGR